MSASDVIAVDLPIHFTDKGEFVELYNVHLETGTFIGAAPVQAFLQLVETMEGQHHVPSGPLAWMEVLPTGYRDARFDEVKALEKILARDVQAELEG